MSTHYDVTVVGASFSGLACARSAARRGLTVQVLERKRDAGERMRTTGLLVKEVAEAWEAPRALTRNIHGVRLYSPSLYPVDLTSPGYYFQATDTGNLMRWLATEAVAAGARLRCGTPYRSARLVSGEVVIDAPASRSRFLVGADGPLSRVARDFRLGVNRHFLMGVEAEFENVRGMEELLHCFIDSRLAHGYIGWAFPGVKITQIGLACLGPQRPRLDAFLEKISGLFDLDAARLIAKRGGLIPIGGRVMPVASGPVLLTRDAAGIVSPLTAGGIHTALESGWRAAHAIADHLTAHGNEPATVIAHHYPRFFWKGLLRSAYDLNPPDALIDWMIRSPPLKAMAKMIYFHRRGLLAASAWRDVFNLDGHGAHER